MDRKFTLSCCSTVDLPYSYMESRDIPVLFYTYVVDGVEYDDDMGRDPEALPRFYRFLEEGKLPQTSQINVAAYMDFFENLLQKGDLLHIAFTSGQSGSVHNAFLAAEELREKYPERTIYVVDTLCASRGEGLLVWYACKKRDEGMTLDELHKWVEDTKLHLCHWFTVDDLMYLKRGGRISAATALVGTMLKVKPVLHVDNEGHLINMFKVRGRKASLEAIANKLGELGGNYDNSTVFICHGDCIDDAEYTASLIREKTGAKTVIINYVGPVIGAHTGPGVISIFFVGTHR